MKKEGSFADGFLIWTPRTGSLVRQRSGTLCYARDSAHLEFRTAVCSVTLLSHKLFSHGRSPTWDISALVTLQVTFIIKNHMLFTSLNWFFVKVK